MLPSHKISKLTEFGIISTAVATLILAGCGGGNSSGSASNPVSTVTTLVTPYKGRFTDGSVVLRNTNGNVVSLTSGGSINASGVASVTYPANVAYPLTIEVSGTFLDETSGVGATGTISAGAPLRGLIPAVADAQAASGVPVTVVTELARSMLPASGFSAASAVAAITGAASSVIGVASYSQAMLPPVFNSQGQTSDATTLKLTALAHVINQQGTGANLPAKLQSIAAQLAAGSAVNAVIPQSAFASAVAAVNAVGGASGVLPVGATPPAIPAFTLPSGSLGSAIGGSGGAVAPTPTISSFNPATGTVGTTVTISGTNFDPDPFHMQVSFGGNVSATIVSASATQLVVTVPAGASTGKIRVTNGLTLVNVLSAADFTVTGSTPSNTWTQRSSGSAYILNTVTYGNGLFLAGGLGNTILSSANGISWTSRSSTGSAQPDANYFGINGLAWSSASSLFIAVGDRTCCNTAVPPLLATSPDGITWTRASLAAGTYSGANLADVTADSNGITAVGAGYIFYSTDGSAWSSQAVPSGMGATLAITGVASSGATRVAVGYDSNVSPAAFILASTDASSWTRVTAPAGFAPQDVIWNGSMFVAVGSSSPIQMGVTPQIATSSDGQTWTLQTMPPAVAGSAYMLNDIAWDGSRFIAVGSPYALVNSRLILSSTDGSTWAVEQEITTGSGQKVLNGIASSGTVSVSVGDSVFTKP